MPLVALCTQEAERRRPATARLGPCLELLRVVEDGRRGLLDTALAARDRRAAFTQPRERRTQPDLCRQFGRRSSRRRRTRFLAVTVSAPSVATSVATAVSVATSVATAVSVAAAGGGLHPRRRLVECADEPGVRRRKRACPLGWRRLDLKRTRRVGARVPPCVQPQAVRIVSATKLATAAAATAVVAAAAIAAATLVGAIARRRAPAVGLVVHNRMPEVREVQTDLMRPAGERPTHLVMSTCRMSRPMVEAHQGRIGSNRELIKGV